MRPSALHWLRAKRETKRPEKHRTKNKLKIVAPDRNWLDRKKRARYHSLIRFLTVKGIAFACHQIITDQPESPIKVRIKIKDQAASIAMG